MMELPLAAAALLCRNDIIDPYAPAIIKDKDARLRIDAPERSFSFLIASPILAFIRDKAD